MSTTPRIALACVLTALGLGCAAPALASPARSFDYFTTTESTEGRAHIYGSIDFERRTQAYIQGSINDLCPGDGHGAYATFYGQYAKTDGAHHTLRKVQDIRTCTKQKPVRFKFWTPEFRNKKLIHVIVQMWDCDLDAAGNGVCRDFVGFERRRGANG